MQVVAHARTAVDGSFALAGNRRKPEMFTPHGHQIMPARRRAQALAESLGGGGLTNPGPSVIVVSNRTNGAADVTQVRQRAWNSAAIEFVAQANQAPSTHLVQSDV